MSKESKHSILNSLHISQQKVIDKINDGHPYYLLPMVRKIAQY